MAKVKSMRFFHEGKTGEKIEFTTDVTVDSNGVFSITAPDELANSATALAKESTWRGVSVHLAVKYYKMTCMDLGTLENFVKAAMVNHLACEVTEDLVIAYSLDSTVSYIVDAEGRFGRTGYDIPGGTWHGKLHGGSSPAPGGRYSVALGAHVFKRRTFTRPTGVKVTYTRPDFPNRHEKLDNPGEQLNTFIAMYPDPERSKIIPYSDEAAAFFVNVLMGLCKLSHQMDQFIGNDAQLQLSIARGTLGLGFTQEAAQQDTPEVAA